jgi:beta-alanine degradation protein BauB
MHPTTPSHLDGVDLAGELVGEDFAGWSDDLRAEFIANLFNYEVGTVLLSHDDRVKVWYIRVPPGERLGAQARTGLLLDRAQSLSFNLPS